MIAIGCGPPDLAIAIVGSPAYFESYPRPLSPANLTKHRGIGFRLGDGTLYRWHFLKNGKATENEMGGTLTLDNDNLVIEAVLRGAGLGYVRSWRVRQHLLEGSLIRVLADWSLRFKGLSLFYPRQRNNSAGLKAFIDFVRNASSQGAGQYSAPIASTVPATRTVRRRSA